MKATWTVALLEWHLMRHTRALWIVALVLAIIGLWSASMIQEGPQGAWGDLSTAAWLVTLILVFATGGQISYDREHGLAAVLLSTPISTRSYVGGKSLAGVAVVFALTTIWLGAAVLMDHTYHWQTPPAILGHSHFPGVGARLYLACWALLILPPALFGAMLALALITLAGSNRIVVSVCALLLWMVSLFGAVPDLLDVTAFRLNNNFSYLYLRPGAGPDLPGRIVQMVQDRLPPSLGMVFVCNRLSLLGCTLLLFALTLYVVARHRRGMS